MENLQLKLENQNGGFNMAKFVLKFTNKTKKRVTPCWVGNFANCIQDFRSATLKTQLNLTHL